MKEKVSLYLATRNRNIMLDLVLKNVEQYLNNCFVYVGNCSSKKYFQETSEVVKKYNFAIEVKYEKDPGMANVYSELYKMIETEYSIVWADDVFFLKKIDNLISYMDNNKHIVLAALPMIDDLEEAPSQRISPWPVDDLGCVLWETNSGRCTNHSIVNHDYFLKFGDVFTIQEPIDHFFHNHTIINNRYWPNNGAYIIHKRIDDETRINSLLSGNLFRYNVGHQLRCGSNVSSLEEREKQANKE